MARIPLIKSQEHPYHIFSRSNNKEWFCLPLDNVWEICKQSLFETFQYYPFSLKAFILMENHYHMLLNTPEKSIDLVMREFNRRFTLKFQNKTNRINKILGGRYKGTIIQNDVYYLNVMKYVLQNPQRAGSNLRCEDYPFSTYHYQFYEKFFPTPIDFSFDPKEEWNEWLNHLFSKNKNLIIQKGLKKSLFSPGNQFPKDSSKFELPRFVTK